MKNEAIKDFTIITESGKELVFKCEESKNGIYGYNLTLWFGDKIIGEVSKANTSFMNKKLTVESKGKLININISEDVHFHAKKMKVMQDILMANRLDA